MRTDIPGGSYTFEFDPRVTPLGQILRDYLLDETPQVWNLLRGDTSLFGPRSYNPRDCEFLRKELPNFDERQGVKPGLISLAIILHRRSSGFASEREFRNIHFRYLQADLEYIESCSWRKDLRVIILGARFLFRTLTKPRRRKGDSL
jgi:lipopolysaccharide/colanic/teichoic acid biosynthesis glycosyltransferase